MANELTALYYPAFLAVRNASRDMTGFISSAVRDAKTDGVSIGNTIDIPKLVSDGEPTDIVVGMTPSMPSDTAFGVTKVSITNSKRQSFGFTGDQIESLKSDGGAGYGFQQALIIESAIKKLVKAVETELAKTAALGASRAYGTAGTVPFSSTQSVTDSAALYKILEDNGISKEGRNTIVSSNAGFNLRTLKGLQSAAEAGDNSTLRRGVIGQIHGSDVITSAYPYQHTAGDAASRVVGTAAAIGATEITLKATGTGDTKPGDVIHFGSDTGNKYVVSSAINSNKVTINSPGLRKAVAVNDTVTLAASYEAGVLLGSNSLLLAARAPYYPEGGDLATDRFPVTDPVTGLTFTFDIYKGVGINNMGVSLAWGTANIADDRTALLIG